MSSQKSDINHLKDSVYSQGRFQKEFISLAIKTFLLIAVSWTALYVFGAVVKSYIVIEYPYIQQITNSAVTVAISFTVISAIRRLLQKMTSRLGLHVSASISFFIVVTISLIAIIILMYQWNIDPQSILIGGGVAAIIVGIGISTIVGNILSGGIMLTTFPAKIGDSIYILNDNIHGNIEEVNLLYTKVMTDEGTEYIVPNNAILQGQIRITKDLSRYEQLPFVEGDHVELTNSSKTYIGTVYKITPNFTTVYNDDNKNEVIISNRAIIAGQFIIVKNSNKKTKL
jgi:small conductance mechanosensitive channel